MRLLLVCLWICVSYVVAKNSSWFIPGWMMPSVGLPDVTGCPGSVITVLMLSPSKVQYCDNWRMAANLTRPPRASWVNQAKWTREKKNSWQPDSEGAEAWCYLFLIWGGLKYCVFFVVACPVINLFFKNQFCSGIWSFCLASRTKLICFAKYENCFTSSLRLEESSLDQNLVYLISYFKS